MGAPPRPTLPLTQHVLWHWGPQDVPCEFTGGLLGVDPRGAFKHLQDKRLVTLIRGLLGRMGPPILGSLCVQLWARCFQEKQAIFCLWSLWDHGNFVGSFIYSTRNISVTPLTCTTALVPDTSSTCPLLWVPLGRVKLTISAYWANWQEGRAAQSHSEVRGLLPSLPQPQAPFSHLVPRHSWKWTWETG